jgi:hypothetical protein
MAVGKGDSRSAARREKDRMFPVYIYLQSGAALGR